MKKYTRQRIILDLVENTEIETQEELLNHLLERDIDITQATISRDIKELRLVKILTSNGGYKYTTIDKQNEGTNERLTKIFRTSVLNITKAENIIVVKTLPGTAQVCASAIDNLKIKDIIGTVSGDNTIFLAIRSMDHIDLTLESIQNLLK